MKHFCPTHLVLAAALLFGMGAHAVSESATTPSGSHLDATPRPRPALEFFVAPNGSDTHPGTRRQPFLSLEQARDAIRKRTQLGPLPPGGVTVWIRGGQYCVRDTFTLATQDSGTASAPVVYAAWKGERPVFGGGARLNRFTPVIDTAARDQLPPEARTSVLEIDLAAHGITNRWPLRLGGFASGLGFQTHPMMELYFNGQALPLSRGPNLNEEEIRIAAVVEPEDRASGGKVGRFTYEGDRPARWQGEPALLLYGYWFWDWADSYERVAAIDPARHDITLEPPFHNYGYRPGQRFHAVNALSELDQPGEWCLDPARGRIYFWPPTDPRKADVELSTANLRFVELENVAHVAFEGVTWQFGCRDAIRIQGGSHVRLSGCTIRHFAGNGVEIQGGTDHRLQSCDLHSLGRGGVTLAGGDRKTLTPGRHVVENCHIHDLSRIDHTYTPAVLCSGVGHRLAHNWLHDIRSSAVRLDGNDHVVEYNEICRAVLESDDQGAVDMWGDPTYRGNVYRFNYFHHIGSRWSGSQDAALGQAGIRLDDAICGTLITGNLFYRAGGGGLGFGAIQIHGGKENRLENNLFVDCPAAVSFSPWGDRRWREFVQKPLEAPAIDRRLYLERYPDLTRLAEDHDVNALLRNLAIGCAEFLRREPRRNLQTGNLVTTNRTAFPKADRGRFPEAADPKTMRGFGLDPIPFAEIGLYRDTYRRDLPDRAVAEVRTTGKSPAVRPRVPSSP
jgi:hypothetical protein